MSFLLEDSEEELSAISSSRLGCSGVENIVDSTHLTDSNKETMEGENLGTCNLNADKLQIAKSQSPELKLELGSELNTADSSECSGQISTSDQTAQLQGPFRNATRKTEGAPQPLLKQCVSPTPKIVNTLPQLKKINF